MHTAAGRLTGVRVFQALTRNQAPVTAARSGILVLGGNVNPLVHVGERSSAWGRSRCPTATAAWDSLPRSVRRAPHFESAAGVYLLHRPPT